MKTLLKCIPTNTAGVFYKEIISKNSTVVDKVFLIRYTDENNKQRLKTVGKRSTGINEAYCKATLSEINTLEASKEVSFEVLLFVKLSFIGTKVIFYYPFLFLIYILQKF